jgi:Protein of unknown function (DUF3080)
LNSVLNQVLSAGLCVILLALPACTDQQSLESSMESYRYRLGNVFQVEFQSLSSQLSSPQLLPQYPSRRDLQLPLQPIAVNLLEFLRLSRCDLQRLIGARNSSLGRVMADSQKLIYHQRFISLAEICIRQLRDVENESLAAKVESARRVKVADTPAAVWNASFASQEFQELFSVAASPLTLLEAQQDAAVLVSAIETLGRLLQLSSALDSGELEAQYAVIGSDKYLGRLLRSQWQLAHELDSLSDQIERTLAARSMCLKPQPTAQAKVMQRVFLRFYIGEVQPYIGGVYRQGRDFKVLIESLLKTVLSERSISQSEPFAAYWWQSWAEHNPESVWSRFNASVQRHTLLWQNLLEQCGLRPGQN